jgi:hypothetical protein
MCPTFLLAPLCLSAIPKQQGAYLHGAVREKVCSGSDMTREGKALGGHDLLHPSSSLTSSFLSFEMIVFKMESFLRALNKCLETKLNKIKTKKP